MRSASSAITKELTTVDYVSSATKQRQIVSRKPSSTPRPSICTRAWPIPRWFNWTTDCRRWSRQTGGGSSEGRADKRSITNASKTTSAGKMQRTHTSSSPEGTNGLSAQSAQATTSSQTLLTKCRSTTCISIWVMRESDKSKREIRKSPIKYQRDSQVIWRPGSPYIAILQI